MLLSQEMPGEALKVHRYYDDPKAHHIDIFTSSINNGVVAVTIGLMDYSVAPNSALPVFTEVLMDTHGHHPHIANMLSTVAFCIIKDGWRPAPGKIFPSIVAMYDKSLEVKHVMFTPTIQWETGMRPVSLPGKVIHPLLAVPVTDLELNFVELHGSKALESLWEKEATDVFDWGRKSAVQTPN